MPCSQISGNLLSAYRAGTLPPSVRARVEAHLFACADCRAALAKPEDAPRSAPPKPAPWPRMRLSNRGIAALAAGGFLAALVLYRQASPPPSQEQEAQPRAENAQSSAETPSVAGQTSKPEAGAPAPQRSYTNEDQHSFLEQEKKRMGIRAIVPPSRSDSEAGEEGPPARPMEREQEREAIRDMAERFAQMNQYKQSKLAPMVPVDGSTPNLLNRRPDSQPLNNGPTNGSDSKGRGSDLGSVALATGKEPIDVSVPASADVGPGSPATAGRFLHWKISWSGRTDGLRGPGGAVIRKTEYWEDLWGKLKTAQALPRVDFNKRMAIGVFGGTSDSSASVQIVSVAEKDGRLLIRFRAIAGKSPAQVVPATPYHVVVVPSSILPPAFEQVP